MAQFGKVGTSMGKVDNGGNFDRCFFEFLFGQRNKLRPDADSGNVFVSNDTVIGYLRQNDDFTSENTVIEEIDVSLIHI